MQAYKSELKMLAVVLQMQNRAKTNHHHPWFGDHTGGDKILNGGQPCMVACAT